MSEFKVGQRWGSETEPELGLGTVIATEDHMVKIIFCAVDEIRVYAVESAPLLRVIFKPGDELRTESNVEFTVAEVEEKSAIITYVTTDGKKFGEIHLANNIQFSGPIERLSAQQLDPLGISRLRVKALKYRAESRASKVCGFLGGRVDIIPHQLYIANEVVSRQKTRVLLADEVGLGKTIEACMIIHQLLLTGRAKRIIIMVPDSLVYQWFVEMLRRFNLHFHIVEPEAYAEYDGSPENNPFNDHQLVLVGSEYICNSPWKKELLAADWDVLVVDEAHHLHWTPEESGKDYQMVEELAQTTDGVILLTATPEQFGIASHFARLRLLDPDRYYSLEEFIKENADYQHVAEQAKALLSKEPSEARDTNLKALLDSSGTGRVMFRNSRKVVKGFQERSAFMIELEGGNLAEVTKEFISDCDRGEEPKYNFEKDPRIDWLLQLLSESTHDKVLLICHSLNKAKALDEAIQSRVNIKSSLFHEEMNILQRDKNAAYFSNPDGARILICSEIGSEGRNFQFAEHLVLFDLPFDPELLEQRIGRLDRIGRQSTININVPFLKDSPQALLARWYHYALNSFEKNHEYGSRLKESFEQLYQIIIKGESSAKMEKLQQETQVLCTKLSHELEDGRDTLLELSSFNEEDATEIVGLMQDNDEDQRLERFMIGVFNAFGVNHDDNFDGTFILSAGETFHLDIPEYNKEGMTVTFDRVCALSREDVQFLSWDHPLVRGVIDLLCSTPKGNSCFCFEKRTDGSREILLESFFVLETMAPSKLHVDRFLPPTLISSSFNHLKEDCQNVERPADFYRTLRRGNPQRVLGNPAIRDGLLPSLVGYCEASAEEQAKLVRATSLAQLKQRSTEELSRLECLKKVNPSVTQKDIDDLTSNYTLLEQYIKAAVVRLDSVRLIYCGDKLKNK